MNSSQKDPIELALEIFDMESLNMHGPEYHSITPALLVTAYENGRGNRNIDNIKEAIRRGRVIPGGMCGTHGACGAGIGAGIALSIIKGVTPYSKEDRGAANKMTALALEAIGETGGPRCCKRDVITAIETVVEHSGLFEGPSKSRYICSQFPLNDKCIEEECPYYP
jgi:hypothetical protein